MNEKQTPATAENLQVAMQAELIRRRIVAEQAAMLDPELNESMQQGAIEMADNLLHAADLPTYNELRLQIMEIEAKLAAQFPADEPGATHLSGEQVFDIAAPYFKWNALTWQAATEGTITMTNLLAYTEAVMDAIPAPVAPKSRHLFDDFSASAE